MFNTVNSIVPAVGLTPLDARKSAGTVMTMFNCHIPTGLTELMHYISFASKFACNEERCISPCLHGNYMSSIIDRV